VKLREPGTLRYESWQEQDDPTRFVHFFVFRDAEGRTDPLEFPCGGKVHRRALSVVRKPVEFTDHSIAATTEPQP